MMIEFPHSYFTAVLFIFVFCCSQKLLLLHHYTGLHAQKRRMMGTWIKPWVSSASSRSSGLLLLCLIRSTTFTMKKTLNVSVQKLHKAWSCFQLCVKSSEIDVFICVADHRHSSHHIHRPLSKLPSDVRRRKGSKKKKKDKDHKSSQPPCSVPIEEGEDEEEEEEEGTELNSVLSERSESERSKDVEVIILLFDSF